MDCSHFISVVLLHAVGADTHSTHNVPSSLQGSLEYLLCLVSLQGTSGLHGLYFAILLRATSILWCLFPKMPRSGL